jgi:hypothetical protein
MSDRINLKHNLVRPAHLRRANVSLRIRVVLTVGLVFAVISAIMLSAISSAAGAYIADSLRAMFGPQPVAVLESVVFQLQDTINQARYGVTRDGGQVAWTNSGVVTQTIVYYDQPTPVPMKVEARSAALAPTSGQHVTITPTITAKPIPPEASPAAVALGVVDALPVVGPGWQPFGIASPDRMPIMARTALKPDASRPYANAAVIRIDLHRVRLHLVPGTLEPSFAPGLPTFSRPGAIPSGDALRNVLVAAFNGGFKAEHGKYGMMVDGMVIRPPIVGIATLGFYRDGSVRLGTWGQEISQTQDLVAYRQNCPLLVDQGLVKQNINITDVLSWGYTGHNPTTTWRSGLGLSQDGRFLIYVVGNSLTAQSLGDALQQAGAYYGMQLDINSFYTRFFTYEPADAANGASSLKAIPLLQAMSGNVTQYLVPYSRDFFYVTALATTNLNTAPDSGIAQHKSQ